METSSDLSEVIVQFRARLATNTQLISLLSTSARDVRIKRSIDLIEDITLYGGRVSTSAQEILKVCENDSVRHRGLHQPLSLLKSNLSEATDHIMESVKRILLYLEHFKVLDSKAPLPQSTYELTQSTITQQQQLAAQICSTACSNIASSSIKPPGPVPMPYQDSVVTELVSSRDHGLFLLEPRAIGDAYDARWDPNHKVPGTQHGKFLRFPGPFYGPPQEIQGSFDQFCLPEATGILIDSTTEDYEDVKANFESTERLQTRDNEDDGKEFAGLQESLGISLAKGSGEFYDSDSIALYTGLRPRNNMPTAGPYLSPNWQKIRSSGTGDGIWELEDLNRVLQVLGDANRRCVGSNEIGRVIYCTPIMSDS